MKQEAYVSIERWDGCELWGEVQWNLPITKPQETGFFFRCRQVPFRTGTLSLDPRNCRIFRQNYISAMLRFRLN